MKKAAAIRKIQESLAKLEETFVNDKRILAAFTCGSIATATYDQYSDIDLVLLVENDDQKAYFQKVPEILRRSVGLKSAVNEAGEDREWCCLITEDYIGLDLPVFTRADLVPSPKFAEIKILKDHYGLLRRFKKKCRIMRPRFNTKRFVNDMQDIKNDQLYMARAVRKGRLLEAMGECTRVGEELFGWLAAIKGIAYQPPSLRDAEKILTEKELFMLLRTRAKSPRATDIRTAMQALWELTLHVIEEHERKTGKAFPKSYDDVEYARLVDDVYAGRRC